VSSNTERRLALVTKSTTAESLLAWNYGRVAPGGAEVSLEDRSVLSGGDLATA